MSIAAGTNRMNDAVEEMRELLSQALFSQPAKTLRDSKRQDIQGEVEFLSTRIRMLQKFLLREIRNEQRCENCLTPLPKTKVAKKRKLPV